MKESSEAVEMATKAMARVERIKETYPEAKFSDELEAALAILLEVRRLRSELALAIDVIEVARSLTEATLRGGNGNRDTLTDFLDEAISAFDAGRKP